MKTFSAIILLPLFLWAQFQFIPINVDYASYASSDTSAYLDVYLSFFQGNLNYADNGDGSFTAAFVTKVTLEQNGTPVRQFAHNYQNTTRDTSNLRLYNQFVDIFTTEIPYGKYQANVELLDKNSMLKGQFKLDIVTIERTPELFLSDIELCTQIRRDTTKNLFYKNGLRVVPNAQAVYNIAQPMLYYYVELNNLDYSPDEKRFYEFEYAITTTEGDTIKSRGPVRKPILAGTLVEAGGLNVMALPRQFYFLAIKATDLATKNVATSRKKFFVFKPVKNDTSATQGTTAPEISEVYLTMNKKDMQQEFRVAKYIATRNEEKVFSNLENEDAMRKFLTSFWNRRDKTAHLAYGASRQKFMQRVEAANARFRAMGKEGWRTDQGRVFIIYGEPDEYERFPSSMDLLPYVIWYYHNLEGGAQFIFADQEGFGDFELIHSTYRKELQNPDWQTIIRKKSGSGSQF